MTDPDGIDEGRFLVQSPHRIEMLRALRDGPRTRGELTERADVSRVTMGRSLGDRLVDAREARRTTAVGTGA
jgi:DNA-binding transcriptional ArsR family regulator